MAFTILDKMAKPGDDLYYDPAFRLVLETHLNLLISQAAAREEIPLDLFYQYEGDFYGYLVSRSIPPEYHFILLRMNGMTNPNQFAKQMRNPNNPTVNPVLIRPNQNQIDGIVRLYMSRKFK